MQSCSKPFSSKISNLKEFKYNNKLYIRKESHSAIKQKCKKIVEILYDNKKKKMKNEPSDVQNSNKC